MTAIATTAPATVRSRPATDVLTMLRRNLLRAVRYPGLTMFLVAGPLVMLVLFVYIFGGALGAGVMPGVAPGADGRAAYLDYITPTLFILTIVGAGQSVAISAAMDAASGIMSRFKTMAISPGSVLSGQVLGTVLQSLAAIVLVLGAALAMGYRPDAGALDWLALLGLFVLLGLALSWLCVAMGLNARSVETASNTPMILLLLPFLGSGFVPVETMPTAVRWFAEYQPFTPIIETVRGLLAGGAGLEAAVVAQAVGWTVAIGVGGYAWARSLYRRERRL
ncbi:ABC transporter permease [Rhodococcus maanshanensis]|uniref:Transport permease protein n=1 Tax=Rhodococcus maanshanensis TaxID=183556 RepID=A0A1H7RY12_9NOCA|nr:ABC transporter permease [Rhodococcus maanshanensis]SEL65122.1 ABC-2 type transport system permease protein [Rhodococcus maanshanensis]